MKKIIRKKNNNNEVWFSWLTGKFNSYDYFKEFASGQDPEDIANNFISLNQIKISKIIDKFDDDDKDDLDHFQKLSECEWHIFRILKKELECRNKIKFVDFKNKKRS